MNLDDLDRFKQLDTLNMLAEIDGLPDQLQSAWELGQTQPFEGLESLKGSIRQIVIAGMGGSAIGADLLTAYVSSTCSVPVSVHRDYGLPAFARGKETLVIASSHSGNTEETLEAFETALKNRLLPGWSSVQAANWRSAQRKTISRSGYSTTPVSRARRSDSPLGCCWLCLQGWS